MTRVIYSIIIKRRSKKKRMETLHTGPFPLRLTAQRDHRSLQSNMKNGSREVGPFRAESDPPSPTFGGKSSYIT